MSTPTDGGDALVPGGGRPFAGWERAAWTVLNASTAPVWLAMILAPRARLTAAVVRLATPLYTALGVTYAGLLVSAAARGDRIDFRDPESVRVLLGEPHGLLAGWTHYLTFDLFVGRWIWATGHAEGRSTRLALLLTWLAGPAGLTLFLGQRASWRRSVDAA